MTTKFQKIKSRAGSILTKLTTQDYKCFKNFNQLYNKSTRAMDKLIYIHQ
jgi:hypothetical protein